MRIVLVFLLWIVAAAPYTYAAFGQTELQQAQEHGQITAPVIIDVRSEAEWETGHYAGAIHIEWQQILSGVNALTLDKAQPIILYCRSGNRAGKAQQLLKDVGYSHVINGINLTALPQVLAEQQKQ